MKRVKVRAVFEKYTTIGKYGPAFHEPINTIITYVDVGIDDINFEEIEKQMLDKYYPGKNYTVDLILE